MNDVKYKQLADALKKNILSGKYGEGNPFPSIRALIRRHSLSNTTVLRALDELMRQGLIARRQGRGTVVTGNGASRRIGLIVPGVAQLEFFVHVIAEISRLARQNDYELLLGEVYSADERTRMRQVGDLAAMFVRRKVSGLIYQGSGGDTAFSDIDRRIVAIFDRKKIPVVMIDDAADTFMSGCTHDVVGIDDLRAGLHLGEHLISVGARKIHYLFHHSGHKGGFPDRKRLYGLRLAMWSHGIPVSDADILNADPDDVNALRRHIRRGTPDAFVCSNDIVAAAFLNTIRQVGLSVPGDVMLAGFGDLSISRMLTPSLTTVRQSSVDIAKVAFGRLLARLDDNALVPQEIFLPAPVIVRESTSRPARRRRAAMGRKSDVKVMDNIKETAKGGKR